MISPQHTLLNLVECNNKNQMNLTILDYNALKSCIHKYWTKAIKMGKNPLCLIQLCIKFTVILKTENLRLDTVESIFLQIVIVVSGRPNS